MKRYLQMIPLVKDELPSVIVEVGVHRAVRAAMLCETVLSFGERVHYIGYDVFETETHRFQEKALNGKGIATEAAARARLRLTERKVEEGKFTYQLIVGNTKKTLHGKKVEAEFAFIDGDHRVETIRGDYQALSDVPIVIFDDYYLPDERGFTVDLNKYGANRVVDELADTADVTILAQGDRVKHGGMAHLALVRKR